MRLKPWYDAYGGPYKDRYRSWTGVLLLVRIVLALVVAFEKDPVINVSVLAWTCLFLISLLSLIKVYNLFLLNALELMFLACLLILTFMSTTGDGQIAIVLSVVPCSLLLIVFAHTCRQLTQLRRVKSLVDDLRTAFNKFGSKETHSEKEMEHSCKTKENLRITSGVATLETDSRTNQFRESFLEEEL